MVRLTRRQGRPRAGPFALGEGIMEQADIAAEVRRRWQEWQDVRSWRDTVAATHRDAATLEHLDGCLVSGRWSRSLARHARELAESPA